MPISVSDARSSPNDQIRHAAKVLGRSQHRRQVFSAIYRGKQKRKTVGEISLSTKLSRIRVLQEGKILAQNHIVQQVRWSGDTAYEKDDFYSAQKKRILNYADNPGKLASLPTKVTPHLATSIVKIQVPKQLIRAEHVTIDEIDSFHRVHNVRQVAGDPTPMLEKKFKAAIQQIIGEQGTFQDWGGERNDLLTTRVRFKGKRIAAALAFKGRGTQGVLTPKAMGKRGDQVQRLFFSPADLFLIQYWGQIGDGILEQMTAFAQLKSIAVGKTIYYGVIDGQDSLRIKRAYKRYFK